MPRLPGLRDPQARLARDFASARQSSTSGGERWGCPYPQPHRCLSHAGWPHRERRPRPSAFAWL
eukprot:14124757-Alexandrium_andersonii.AAC.1